MARRARTPMIKHILPTKKGFRPYINNAAETPFGWLVELRQVGIGRTSRSISNIYWFSVNGKITLVDFPVLPQPVNEWRLNSGSAIACMSENHHQTQLFLQRDGRFLPVVPGSAAPAESIWHRDRHHIACQVIDNVYADSYASDKQLVFDAERSFAYSNKEMISNAVMSWMFELKNRQALLFANPRSREFKVLDMESDIIHKVFIGEDIVLVCTDKNFLFIDIPLSK